ncbi:hypothetical protein STHU_36830 [Allostella humosa]|nr:DUF1491 family protein [Stella humosa]BBK33049.1 hypothetical protein STHU_36830 [Stella humosa]
MEPRLKSRLWIAAEIRRCAVQDITAVVARRGDPDAGAILLKVNRFAAGCVVHGGSYGRDGQREWIAATGAEPVPEADADAYVERRRDSDPDLWVLEIEDPQGRYTLGETVA